MPEADIYVYDNNLTDRTVEIAKENAAIVRYEYKQGKGNVVRTMFSDIDADLYVMVDGDDTYPADQVHKLLQPVRDNKADMCIGDCLSNGIYQKENKRRFYEFGNNLVGTGINLLFGSKLKDIMTGYHPLRFYTTIATICFLFGLLIGIHVIIEFISTKYITKVPSAILATGLMIISVLIAQCGVILESIIKINRENYELNLLRYRQIEELKMKGKE